MRIQYLILSALTILVACTSVGERTTVSFGYYNVNGKTFDELDQSIQLHGPNVTGVGKALASTDLKMVPRIKYELKNGKCAITKVRVSVNAKVTLPRHTNEKSLKKELAKAWKNLSEYARVHEAVHLAIADRYALIMEQSIRKLEPQETCKSLRDQVEKKYKELFALHHKEQLEFDKAEKQRIRKLIQSKRKQS